jgi:CNT family concentrative nucleoside transporter
MSHLNLVSALGFCLLLLLAWLIGGAQRPLPWRTLLGGTGFCAVFGAIVFLFPPARQVLVLANDAVLLVLGASSRGAEFLLGPLAIGPGGTTAAGEVSIGVILATQVLPAVIFFSAAMALLRHFGCIRPVVRLFARMFRRVLGLSGAEALVGALHMFFGVESGAAIRPYLATMTRSELLGVLSTNLATVASTVLAVYVLFLRDTFPQIAGHLLSASLLSIPCAVMVSKLVLPERDTPQTLGTVPEMAEDAEHHNAFAALASGALDGVRIAVSIGAILIAVLGLVGVVDAGLGRVALWTGFDAISSLDRILGVAFVPFAWLIGIESGDVGQASRLLAQRLVVTEVVSYQQLGVEMAAHQVSNRTVLVLSYGLCGFAHIAGVGIAVGGFSALAPSRLEDLSSLAGRCLLVATFATLMTGALAGIFYVGQAGLL